MHLSENRSGEGKPPSHTELWAVIRTTPFGAQETWALQRLLDELLAILYQMEPTYYPLTISKDRIPVLLTAVC